MEIQIRFEPRAKEGIVFASETPFSELTRQLDRRLSLPFSVSQTAQARDVHIQVGFVNGILHFTASRKRLESSTIYLFILWSVGLSIVLLAIAILFLRNQIRPIIHLADAAERFGKGQSVEHFGFRGAREVKQAARAFAVMRERIERQLTTRMEMLAGISHDLRTPLTRMKLQLALLETKEARALEDDVAQMEHMVQEYIDFAKGVGGEESTAVSLSELLGNIVQSYRYTDSKVTFTPESNISVTVRPQAFRRMLTNVIDNALRYGKTCHIQTRITKKKLTIIIDDEGSGIAPEHHAEVFKPFTRLEASRNMDTGGVGLGLSIAQDIMMRHGGTIALDQAPSGGLRVRLQLPL